MQPVPPRRGRLWDSWSPLQLAVFALLLLGAQMLWQVAVHALTGDVFIPVIVAAFMAVVLPCGIAAGRHGESLSRAFQLRLDRGAMVYGALAGLLAVVPTSLLAGVSARLHPPSPEYLAYLAEQLPRGAGGVLVALAAVSVAAPLGEELIFRGLLFRLARDRWGAARAASLTALFFGIAHLQPWSLFGLVGLGVLLALLYHWTGSLLAPVAAHGAHNAVSLALLIRMRGDLAAQAAVADGAAETVIPAGAGQWTSAAGWLLAAASLLLLWLLLRRLRRLAAADDR